MYSVLLMFSEFSSSAFSCSSSERSSVIVRFNSVSKMIDFRVFRFRLRGASLGLLAASLVFNTVPTHEDRDLDATK